MEYCVITENGIDYRHVVICRNLHETVSENKSVYGI